MIRIRGIEPGDWAQITTLEFHTYDPSGLSEGREALESRAAPGTSFVACAGAELVGYVLALPYARFASPELGGPSKPAGPGGELHLHDLVIGAQHRRQGLATLLHEHFLAAAGALAYRHVSLVAVGGSDTFWAARGYRRHRDVPVPPCYGADAMYMSREVELHGR
ncbi:GNAT family N-acetyltransferase [Actinoplanes sp. TFC3]|uniref:GNAT family N-acetyltransferase n=1 Tax=Actinoplanes sp. TFC3 TaxID=1710355 RepID=UPI00083084A3|nr:GNAT family N-acetyltransferase [Actinoplanes sp. TFC3]